MAGEERNLEVRSFRLAIPVAPCGVGNPVLLPERFETLDEVYRALRGHENACNPVSTTSRASTAFGENHLRLQTSREDPTDCREFEQPHTTLETEREAGRWWYAGSLLTSSKPSKVSGDVA
jgi:hypothetical protein